jgi:hypothetical protein
MTLTQSQCEAFADVLVLAMCIDGHFSLLEEEAIQKKIDSVGWNENLSPSIHISGSIARARDVADSTQQVRIYLEKITAIFDEPAIARFVLDETIKVLESDGTSVDEGVFTAQLQSILKL